MRTPAALLVLIPMTALAETPQGPLYDQHWKLNAGIFVTSTDTEVRLNGTANRTGTSFDAEEELGLDDASRFRVEAAWRFAGRHSLEAMYFKNDRTSTRTLEDEIEFGDTTYPVDAQVRARNDTEILQVSYEYSFLQRPSYELAASIGIHRLSFDLALDADLGGTGQSASRHESAQTHGPLPVFGLRGTWALTDSLLLNAQVKFFAISFDDYSGNIQDWKADLTWMFTRHVGIGVGYNAFRFNVDVDKPAFDGSLNWSYGGALAFVSARF